MTETNVRKEYFDWMCHIVCGGRFARENSYRKLLAYLHEVEFVWMIPKDANRAEDGESLRWRFAYENHMHIGRELDGPCSVLEMILALAIRCENDIMDDSSVGDRTGQWFWKMINNLGLSGMTDRRFDANYVEEVIDRFLHRDYEPDGHGGLFVIHDCPYDLREVEIWTAMLWYLDSIT